MTLWTLAELATWHHTTVTLLEAEVMAQRLKMHYAFPDRMFGVTTAEADRWASAWVGRD